MIRDEQIARIIGAVALALVLGALGFQYVAHLAPCEMCHWQRWPHIVAAVIGLGIVAFWKKDARLPVIATLVIVTLAGLVIANQWRNAPAIAAMALAFAGFALWKKDTRGLALMAVTLVALSGLIAAYQWGMQLGFLPGPQACTGQRYVMGSNVVPEVSCDAVTWSLFGLSLAAYNALVSLGAAALGAFLLVKNRK